MKCWQPVHSAPCLWAVRDAPWSAWFPVLCFALHFLCWALMFSTLLLYDYLELLGVKQVACSHITSTQLYKSIENSVNLFYQYNI